MRKAAFGWIGLAGLLGGALGCSDNASVTSTTGAGGAASAAGAGGCGPGLTDCGDYCSDACPAGCAIDHGDCNNDPADGCEVDLAFDAQNCGACGEDCPSPANGHASCSLSKCEIACDYPFQNCDGDPANGCEASTQTDAQNCLVCGNVCDAGLVCAASHCTGAALASGLNAPQDLIVVGGTIYWTDAITAPNGTITAIGVDGAAQTVLATGLATPANLTADATNIYFSSMGTPPDFLDGAIMKLPLGGGAPIKIADAVVPGDVVVDGTTVYWTSAGSMANDGAVLSMPIGGGPVTTIAANQAAPYALALDASNLYWAASGSGEIWEAPIGGGPATMLTIANQPFGVAIDATSLYWAEYGTSSINRVPLLGGPPALLSSGLNFPYAVAVDGNAVYFSVLNPIPGTIRTVPLAGGATTTLAVGWTATAIALDATNVYWLEHGENPGDGALEEIAKQP